MRRNRAASGAAAAEGRRQVMSRRPLRVVIVGAGIGGLAAAVALRQRGAEVRLYERSVRLEEVGAGIQVGPNAVKVLRALGLEEELRRHAFEPRNMISLRWDDAALRHREPLKATAVAKYGAAYLTAHRADLHGLLRAALPDGVIRLGANCVGAETADGGAVARFADGSEVEGDAVIGADGIRSSIRSQLFGADQPRFTEMMCWRAMVPMACVPTKIGPGGSVTLEHGEYFGWIGPNGHVICYPIGNGDTLNIFAGHDDVATALRAYVAERQPRTSRVTLQSRQQFANNRKVPPPPFLDRSWIFAFDATRDASAPAPA